MFGIKLRDGCVFVLLSLHTSKRLPLSGTEALEDWTIFVKTFVIKVTGSLTVYLIVACSVSLARLGQVLMQTFAELLAERLSLRSCGCPSIVCDMLY